MQQKVQLSHIAFLVTSAHEAAKVAKKFGFSVSTAESWEGEGTLEIYVGDPSLTNRLLLMEPEHDGAYRRALKKRGPGLQGLGPINPIFFEFYI